MPAIYQAELWCDDCADAIKDEICNDLSSRDDDWRLAIVAWRLRVSG